MQTPSRKIPRRFSTVDPCIDALLEKAGKEIVLGLPLGIGKANHFANALYARAAADPSISLTIFTALTLERPRGDSDILRRFIQPLLDRLYSQYQDLAYASARRRQQLPSNIEVIEFFMAPGALLGNDYAQQHYASVNYTQVPEALLSSGVNVIAQMVSPTEDGARFSLSCNSDLTLPFLKLSNARDDHPLILVGEVNPQLPYITGTSELDATEFDFLLEGATFDTPLFAAPAMPVGFTEYSIGVHIASLIADGGTLQLGIGALGDAVCHALRLRHLENGLYRRLIEDLNRHKSPACDAALTPMAEPFRQGLYAVSEMFPHGFLHLRRAGILTREVYADAALQALLDRDEITHTVNEETLLALKKCGRISCPLTPEDTEFLQRFGIVDASYSWRGHKLLTPDGEEEECDLHSEHGRRRLIGECLNRKLLGGIWLHGGFYLGPELMYRELRDLPPRELAGIDMTGIDFTNDLQSQRALKRAQRRQARFVNSAMMVTLGGAVVSDGLVDNQVVSGVGGQYNFVAQAFELPGARSIIALPSTRYRDGICSSNIVWEYPHTTIPRHLRDVVVTEYGAVDLRGKTDRDVMVSMLSICDARFQPVLLEQAKHAGKIEKDFVIPAAFNNNTPGHITKIFTNKKCLAMLPYYPLGTDFTNEEALLAVALEQLKAADRRWWWMLLAVIRGRSVWHDNSKSAEHIQRCLTRMGYDHTETYEHRLEAYVVASALRNFVDMRRPLYWE
ncbi:acetyl-CoA hydrolase/transferase C-terminal domain-containing protein [Microbulbifer sp. 2205BS26-8]|uniref:acetyl-CoA hydrolase/transferase C-terminal domain-containing protein n=1 Tax=Microbulbifer sp. 2205BS26-8 TaxID=3064386 RepID=UPI00273F3BBD|nr:acetyl-CoA hydrolase/transferase C-terminal domain-containing protein [Microbulbifer sp. 2205BS26-8]MDP5208290.1 acetyl-CoA hydrolase/transferase C-terminal domain-containing protein [Microbulbifer sp. 2205BS26-8]